MLRCCTLAAASSYATKSYESKGGAHGQTQQLIFILFCSALLVFFTNTLYSIFMIIAVASNYCLNRFLKVVVLIVIRVCVNILMQAPKRFFPSEKSQKIQKMKIEK